MSSAEEVRGGGAPWGHGSEAASDGFHRAKPDSETKRSGVERALRPAVAGR